MVPESYNISWLSINLGCDRRTLQNRLRGVEPAKEVIAKNGKTTREYFIQDAARCLFQGADAPDYMKEKAGLERAKREKEELTVAELKGDLVRADEITAVYVNEVTNLKQRVFGIPSQIAAYLVDVSDAGQVEAAIHDALHEQFSQVSHQVVSGDDAADTQDSQ